MGKRIGKTGFMVSVNFNGRAYHLYKACKTNSQPPASKNICYYYFFFSKKKKFFVFILYDE